MLKPIVMAVSLLLTVSACSKSAEQCRLDERGAYKLTVSLSADQATQDAQVEALTRRAAALNPECEPLVERQGSTLELAVVDIERVDMSAAQRLAVPGQLWVKAYGASPPEAGSEVPRPADALVLEIGDAKLIDGPQPAVQVTLSETSGKAFGDLTATHVGDFVALGVDDRVLMSPKVMEPITGGQLQITVGAGDSAVADTRALAEQLARPAVPGTPKLELFTEIGPARGAR